MKVKLHSEKGFSYVKMAILMGLIAILLLIMLPGYQDDTIRERVVQGLNAVEPVKQALVKTCQSKSDAVISRNSQAGYAFYEHMYVADVKVAANCKDGTMSIRVSLQNTGAGTEPEIVLMSKPSDSPESGTDDPDNNWNCLIAAGKPTHVPVECRMRAPVSEMPQLARS